MGGEWLARRAKRSGKPRGENPRTRMSGSFAEQLALLARDHLGLRLEPQGVAALEGAAYDRAGLLGAAESAYLMLLAGRAAEQEWAALAEAVTNTETYFLRDRGLFD